MCCHLTMRVRNAGRRRFTCTRARGSRNALVVGARCTAVVYYTSLRAAPRRRFGLRWRGRLDATSREYLTPSPRHQPRPHGPPVRTLLPPRRHHHPPPPPIPRVRARSHSRADNRAVSLSSRRDPSLFATSFGVCPRCSFLPPSSPTLSLLPFRELSLALHSPTPGVWYLPRPPPLSPPPPLSLSLSSFSPPSPPPASAAVSMPRSDDGRSQTHPGARGDRR